MDRKIINTYFDEFKKSSNVLYKNKENLEDKTNEIIITITKKYGLTPGLVNNIFDSIKKMIEGKKLDDKEIKIIYEFILLLQYKNYE